MMQTSNTITPREQFMMEAEKENLRVQLEHQKEMKQLELEVGKINSKWTTIFRLPLAIIKLPVQLVVAGALVVYAIRGVEPPEALVAFLGL